MWNPFSKNMPDKESIKVDNESVEKKKGTLGKLKDKILPDESEKAAIISTMVRLGVLVWSGGILTLNYVTVPGIPQQKIDPTFIASVFTGVLASFGIQTASKKGDGTMKMEAAAKAAAANGGGTVQTIRIEQLPLKIIAADIPSNDKKSTEPEPKV